MWRQTTGIALTLAALAGLSGCAFHSIHSGGKANRPDNNEVPIAANFRTSTQLKLQAAEHWKRVASSSAAALAKSLRDGGACLPKSACAIHLRRSCETTGCAPQACDTTFNRVFYNDFLTALVGLGYQVSAAATAGAVVIDMDIQVVSFSSNRPQYRYAGEPVEIGPGVWALRDVTSLVDGSGSAALRTLDHDTNWYRTEFAAGPTPRNELVVSVSALSPQQRYVARNTSVYYTADSDSALYSCQAPLRSRTWMIPVTGDCTGPRCTQGAERGR